MFAHTTRTLKDHYNITAANSGPHSSILMDCTTDPKKPLGEFHYAQLDLAERTGGAAGIAALVGREAIPGTGIPMPTVREQKHPFVQAEAMQETLPTVDPNQPIQTQLDLLRAQVTPGSEIDADLAAAQEGIGETPQSFMKEQRERMAEGEATPSVPPQEESDFMGPEK